MAKTRDHDIQLLAIGELLVDLISTQTTDSLATVKSFERHQGGSPANIAVNIARLGGTSALMANVGDDAFGAFLKQSLAHAGVITDYITLDPDAHTSVVFVARTKGTPDFLPMREADLHLGAVSSHGGISLLDAIHRTEAVHVSSWPLRRDPARSFAHEALRRAMAAGKLTSLDPNYSPQLWPDRHEALDVLQSVLRDVAIVKPSLDDAARLFGQRLAPDEIVERFHTMGPATVILTMGKEGTLLSESGTLHRIPGRKIEVADATGAGDAFWSGFLLAKLEGLTTRHAAYVAREIAERKLQTVGPLPGNLDRKAIYQRAGSYL
ncbi:MAG: carbohydrate kinase [Anaerolineae bacterium]|nr:carbohydrate kinase [Anaerolineae bacterium]